MGGLAATGVRISIKAFGRFLLFAVVIGATLVGYYAVLSFIPFTASLLLLARAGTITIALMVITDGLGLATVILYCAIASRMQRVPFGSFALPVEAATLRRLLQGFAFGMLIASLDIGVTYLSGGIDFVGFAVTPFRGLTFGFAWAITFVLIALFEEALYRGYALLSLSAAIGFWPASVSLAALFAGFHLLNPGETVVGALDVFCYALLASYTLWKTGNLWFAVGLHAAWNFAITVIYSVPGSGMQAKGHLLTSNLVGAPWITGGQDGPEGSVIGLAVLAIGFLTFRRLFPIRKNSWPSV